MKKQQTVQFRASKKARKTRAEKAVQLLTKLDTLGMSPESIAAELGVSPRSIFRWGHRESTPQPSHMTRLELLVEGRGDKHVDDEAVGQ